jgi:homoserine O-acetyltransferase/O-succinyltransferase
MRQFLSFPRIVALLVVAGSGQAAIAQHGPQRNAPPVHTFSIVAFDPETGDLGIAVASRVLGVGSIVPWAQADVGAIATQSLANTAYGPDGLALLKSGRTADQALEQLLAADAGRDHRQVAIVDAQGNVAAYTGQKCNPWTGDRQGKHYSVQGNLLVGQEVLEAMSSAYETAGGDPDTELADWLLAALKAGDDARGDKRGKQSAALMVVRDRAGYLGNDRYIDLRVDDHREPVHELARLLDLHQETFAWGHQNKPIRNRPPELNYPTPVASDVVISDFEFQSGETLPELRMHYLTIGKPRRNKAGDIENAVLILHGTTGSSQQFLRPEFATELFGPGQPLDAEKYLIILPDNIGHGNSAKPSDGLRAKFPRYGYLDMIEAQRRLLAEGLNVKHARLIIGTSMGGMHSWLWGQLHPDFMDALVPLASLPDQIAGRNRVWRRIVIDAIREDPTWNHGNYDAQPTGLTTAVKTLYFMSSNPVLRLAEAPTLRSVDEALDRYVAERLPESDANDVAYAVDASHDYNPAPGLGKIKAPLLAINFADDLINPPELGVLERNIRHVPHGRAILMPASDRTVGHGTHTKAMIWKDLLAEFLQDTEPERKP